MIVFATLYMDNIECQKIINNYQLEQRTIHQVVVIRVLFTTDIYRLNQCVQSPIENLVMSQRRTKRQSEVDSDEKQKRH
jgi:hypothetical protein